jgi:hypothetical protein
MTLFAAALAAVAASTAIPSPASAQHPGRIFRALAFPLRMIVPRPRFGHRARSHPRLSQAERARAAAYRAGGAAIGAAALWPSASTSGYEEIVGYALWPSDYGERFWSHGARDIITAFMSTEGARKAAPALCSAEAKDSAQTPLARVEQELTLTPDQRDALDALRAAVKHAVERETIACGDNARTTPAQRSAAMADGLWALYYAASYIRAPLATFYRTLTDDQRDKLGQGGHIGTDACRQTPPGMTEGQKGLRELVRFLATTCPQAGPATPMARLDAATDRIAMLAYATMTVDPALFAPPGRARANSRAQLSESRR